LTPAKFGERFGPSAIDMAKISGWLQSQGFAVEAASNGRQFLVFTGTRAQVESAFQTEMHRYRVNGKAYFGNAKAASIPSALAPAVSGTASLNSLTQWQPEYHLAANPTIKVGTSALTGPADLAAIYDVAPLQKANVLGQGQSIALIEESNINPQDVADFRKLTGLPAATVNVILNGPDPGLLYGEETEAIADVEYAGALAPDATLNVIVSGSTELNQGIDLSTAYAVDNKISPITSLSYAGCETLNDTYNSNSVTLYKLAYEQGAAEGISHFVSSGDYGGDSCGYVVSRAAVSSGSCPATTGTAYTPLNQASPGSGTTYTDASPAPSVCYTVQAL
jgi:subtilase family serine protease